jgi:mRNA interferase RelE/StbE
MRERLAALDDPRSIGQALRGSELGEFWKYRVGDWRLICQIKYAKTLITVGHLGSRRECGASRRGRRSHSGVWP